MERRVVVVLALIVAAVAGVAAPTAAGVAQDTTQTPNGTAVPTPASVPDGTSGGGSLGGAISSFMQASAAETEGTVDTGMWAAEFGRSDASEHPRMVAARTATLERRLDRLEEERTELLNGSDGNVTVREQARASRLTARIGTLRDALNNTATAAEESGVNATRLETLRTRARGLAGPEVAALAHDLTGNRGPPGDAGPPDATGRAETGTNNRTDASNGNGETGNGRGPGRSDNASNDRGPSGNRNGSGRGSDA